MTVDGRRKRDEQRAAQVKELAAEELKEHRLLSESPRFSTGGTASGRMLTAAGRARHQSLAEIARDPFQAMVEADVAAGTSKRQLWYANTRTATNESFHSEGGEITVVSWTHPGFQLALTAPLHETRELRNHHYLLKSVTPIARARFKHVLPCVNGLYEPGGLVGPTVAPTAAIPAAGALKSIKLHMTHEQVDAFLARMDGFMLISGAPGTGKSTIAFQRVRFLFDQQGLREADGALPYDPSLTAIFLANRNLIEYSKVLLSEELQIPGSTVHFVPEFISQYVDRVWEHKGNARPRQKRLTPTDGRSREAFFHLCGVRELEGLWSTYEQQVQNRLGNPEQADWQEVCEKAGGNAQAAGRNLAAALGFPPPGRSSRLRQITSFVQRAVRGSKPASGPARPKLPANPVDSKIPMDSLYYRIREPYDGVRRSLSERSRKTFDERFARWLYWVYDPISAIAEFFAAHESAGAQRIRAATAEVIPAADVIQWLRQEWEQRVYGTEMEAWIAWLLRFVLPETRDPDGRFREMPVAVPDTTHATVRRWTHVVVDEAQDLSVAEASFLSSLVDPRGAFTVSADFHQVVSPVHGMTKPDALRHAGSIRGEGAIVRFPFRKNLRQSWEIGQFLKDFYQQTFNDPPVFDAGDRKEKLKPQLIVGPRPSLFREVRNMVKQWGKSDSIRTFAFLLIDEDGGQFERTRKDLEAAGLSPEVLDEKGIKPGVLLLTTVERCKGLEFDACIILGLDDIERSSLNFWKNRAYVAVSRPTKRLYMLCEQFPGLLQRVQKDYFDVDRLR